MTKRKQERRELLKEDEFLSYLERAARYIEKEPKKVVAITVAAVLGLGIAFGWASYQKSNKEQKAGVLYKAEKILAADLSDETAELQFDSEKDRYEAALEELDKVIESQSGTVRQQALTHKIACLINLGRTEELERLYRQLVEEDKGMKYLGVMGLGDIKLAAGQHREALDHFNQLGQLGGRFPSMDELVRYKIALCYQGMGDLVRAKEELTSVLGRYEGKDANERHPILTKVEELLAEIEAASPSEDESS